LTGYIIRATSDIRLAILKNRKGKTTMNSNKDKESFTYLEAVGLIHQVAALYMSTKSLRDYGTGAKYSPVEVHTLQDIAELSGPTATDLAMRYGKSKGAISQIIKKLESKKLIQKVPSGKKDNRYLLELTEKGHILDQAHRSFDNAHGGEVMEALREKVSKEDFDTAFRVLSVWLDVRREIHQKRIKAVREE